METKESITVELGRLRSDSLSEREAAAAAIWQRYFPRLLKIVGRKLPGKVRRRVDEEDVAHSAMHSFFVRQQRGDFNLHDRDAFWALLLEITLRKTSNTIRNQNRQRRAVGREMVKENAAMPADASGADWTVQMIAGREPTPDEAVAFEQEVAARLDELPDDLRQVAQWKLEGHTNREIAGADMLKCTERTVERKLKLIRQKWESAIPNA